MTEARRAELFCVREKIEALRQELAQWEARERELFNAPERPPKPKRSTD